MIDMVMRYGGKAFLSGKQSSTEGMGEVSTTDFTHNIL